MKEVELNIENLKKIQGIAVKNAVRENKALGLVYRKIENNMLVEVGTDGAVTVIGKPKFTMVKVLQKTFKLKKK
jgi:hypothetical protein